MKIHISDQGDSSVGISPNEMTVELNWYIKTKQDRKGLRKTFLEFARDTLDFDDRIDVVFDDECSDCLTIMKDGKCDSKGCISNMDDDE